jgi:hypothetical protein
MVQNKNAPGQMEPVYLSAMLIAQRLINGTITAADAAIEIVQATQAARDELRRREDPE